VNPVQLVRVALDGADVIWKGYVADLSDSDLLVRPVPGANHIAWQMGHLIWSENWFINGIWPGSMPALPDGFGERYARDKSGVDDPAAFETKADLLKIFEQQRAGTLAALERLRDEELDQPGPEPSRAYFPTVASVLVGLASHWTMHAGQWAIVRRKLGKPPLF
jgi:hypothetical protein